MCVCVCVCVCVCIYIFLPHSQNREKRLIASSCLPVCLSVRPSGSPYVRVGQLGFQGTIFLLSFMFEDFRQCFKFQVSFKPEKNNGYFTCRYLYIYDIYLN